MPNCLLGLQRNQKMEEKAALPLAAGLGAANTPTCPVVGNGGSVDDDAAIKLQKAYRGYRTRRKLADSGDVVEDLWWQALNFARLNHSTSFNELEPKTATSHWNRAIIKASKVGQGLSQDSKALKLASQHWLEAIDPRHRYGRNLHFYYDFWCQSKAGQPFFYWLDVGDGKDVDLPECPRTLLKKQCVKYLGPQERKLYEYIVHEGKVIHKQSGEPLDTEGAEWIFVMSTERRLYAGMKEKGGFHHSSFLAGGAIIAAGKFTAENGVIKSFYSYSGHYHPSTKDLNNFVKFFEESGVDLNEDKACPLTSGDYCNHPMPNDTQNIALHSNPPQVILSPNTTKRHGGEDAPTEEKYQKTLSDNLDIPEAIDVPQNAILDGTKSKGESEALNTSLVACCP